MADDDKAEKKTVAKKATVKKATTSKKTVARKKTVAKKKPVAKQAPKAAAADAEPKAVATPAVPEQKPVDSKSPEEKKALADKILSVTGAKTDAGDEPKDKMMPKAPADEDTVAAGKEPQPESAQNEDKKAEQVSQVAPIQVQKPADDMSSCMEDFRKTFEASARRWEIIVYPSLLAFVLLAAIGFYMVFMLTGSVGSIADNIYGVGNNMNQVSVNMTTMTTQISELNERMAEVNAQMAQISADVSHQVKSMDAVVAHMGGMNQSTMAMSATMQQMRHDTATMGYNMHSASGPMRFMNSFMPW